MPRTLAEITEKLLKGLTVMVRKISMSQYKSKLRQAQNKQRQAVNKYNQAVRKYNHGVKKAINEYNREVRSHNARVRADRQRIKNELAKLQRRSTSNVRYSVFHTSVNTLNQTYERLEQRSNDEILSSQYNHILDLSEKENANSLETMNMLLDDDGSVEADSNETSLQDTKIIEELKKLSDDLDSRWKGAIFSLNPQNPDAARHFCTSAREIFTQILEIKAPDKIVLEFMPDCEKTGKGKPSRRSKIHYFLQKKDLSDTTLIDFVDNDIDNIVQLFRVFNEGTHGTSGKYDIKKLKTIKKRVEDGLIFLTDIVN